MRLGGVLVCTLLLASCIFGPSRGAKILGYRAGTVYLTYHRQFQVGRLSGDWHEVRSGARAVTLRHAASGAEIMVSTFCGPSYEDAAPKAAMARLFTGFPPVQVDAPETLMLDQRQAMRQRSLRRVDGVAMAFDAVVVAKNECNVDFVLMGPPAALHDRRNDFEIFFRGFHL